MVLKITLWRKLVRVRAGEEFESMQPYTSELLTAASTCFCDTLTNPKQEFLSTHHLYVSQGNGKHQDICILKKESSRENLNRQYSAIDMAFQIAPGMVGDAQFPGQPVQWLTDLLVKKFSISNLTLPQCNFSPFPSVLLDKLRLKKTSLSIFNCVFVLPNSPGLVTFTRQSICCLQQEVDVVR